jgi:hypothetical protein
MRNIEHDSAALDIRSSKGRGTITFIVQEYPYPKRLRKIVSKQTWMPSPEEQALLDAGTDIRTFVDVDDPHFWDDVPLIPRK